MPFSFSNPQWIYDVFINFRGEDTRGNFVSHLHAALSNAGVNTFLDDEKLEKGQELGPELLRAIHGSQISIVVFSKNYVHSSWCLHELVQIMKCHKNSDHLVLPVFQGITPSYLRQYATETFGTTFQGTKKNPKRNQWRENFGTTFQGTEKNPNGNQWMKTLADASHLAGWVINNYSNESSVVKEIVGRVLKKLLKKWLPIPEFPVGLKYRAQKLIEFSKNKTKEVYILGIWGMGGVGKSTVAKFMFNELSNEFEDQCFLANIRVAWEKDRGQIDLQEQLLSDILKTSDIKVHSTEWGKAMIKEKLCTKRAFLVLDDVNKFEQLNALCVNHKVIGSGSIIIITTRDVHLLRALGVDQIYEVEKLDEFESLKLLSWHAFRKEDPEEGFRSLSKEVITYCGGLPLALEVLGSYLYKRRTAEWQSVLSKLKIIPDDQIQEKLKISFDGLKDDMERDIFLDICCFFIGKDRTDVREILNGCGLHADIGMTVLVERSLITVEGNSKIGMHDLLRDMGREIVRKKSIKNLEKRSRLWFHDDALDVLTRNSGTKAIEGLALSLRGTTRCRFNANAFEGMERLRLLQLDHVKLIGDYGCLSKQLRWIYWKRFPLKYMPNKFYQGNVVAMDLRHSNLKLVWKEPQLLEGLKFLNLSHSKYLTNTPDFSKVPNLEKLILEDCPSLCKVHESIGDLSKLLLLNLKNCTSVNNLPIEAYKLKSLEYLNVSGCPKIDKFEEDIEQMESLTTLIAENTAVKHVPFSIVRSKSIGYISLCGYKGLPCDVFPSLIWSWMSPTVTPLSSFNPSGVMPSALVSITLVNGYWDNLSPMLSSLSELRSVSVQFETEFQLSTELRKISDSINGVNFTELEITSYDLQISNHCLRSYLIGMGSYQRVFNTLNNSISEGLATNGSCDINLPGDNPPYWLTHIGEGHSVVFTVPQDTHRDMKGMTLCVVYSSILENTADECLISVFIVNHTKCTLHIHKPDTTVSFNDEDWQGIMSNLGSGDKVEFFVNFGHGLTIKKTLVYLIYDDSINTEIESSPRQMESSLEPIMESSPVLMESSLVPMESSPESKKEPQENGFVRFLKKIVTCFCHKPIISKV